MANRTTLDAAIKDIVDKAVAQMKLNVSTAASEVSALPAAQHGKPADQQQGNKPEDKGKPSR